MNHTARSVVTSTGKRKDREDSSFYNPKQNIGKGNFGNSFKQRQQPMSSANTTSSNQLLAGYMAYEFLTRGTLFGQKFDPARAEAVPLAAADPKRKPGKTEPDPLKPKQEVSQTYAEVAQLLKSDGAHIPGVVNPTQLARWIQM